MHEQQFMEPVSPYALSISGLDRLRAKVVAAEAEASKAEGWTERTRREQDVKVLQRELASAELERTLSAQRASRSTQSRQQQTPLVAAAAGVVVRSDRGHAYLAVQHTQQGQQPQEEAEAFAAPVPYFEKPKPRQACVNNAEEESAWWNSTRRFITALRRRDAAAAV